MERVNFFDGQSIEAEDLNASVDLIASNVKARTVDFFSKGVIGERTAKFVQNDANNKIKILPFIAYSPTGERINMYTTIGGLALNISEETTDPMQKYRLRQQGDLPSTDFGWVSGETYVIYINYLEKAGKPKEQKTTGLFYPTRVYSGFEFYAIPTSISVSIDTTNMVRLASVTFDGTSTTVISSGYLQFASIDAKKIYTSSNAQSPVVYNPRTPVSIEEHIMCLGSGIPSPTNPHGYTLADLGFDTESVKAHETRMHTGGITGTAAARQSVNSALYTRVNSRSGAYDNLIIYNLATNEYLHSNGFWLSSLSAGQNVYLQFTYNNTTSPTPVPNGIYTIGVDPTSGNIVIGSGATGSENIELDITPDSLGTAVLQTTTILSEENYLKSGAFSIASFSWNNSLVDKPVSSIPDPSFTRSNFISKQDLRVFGGTSPLDLATDKNVTNTDILKLPYTVHVDRLFVGSDVEITGASVLPYSFIDGFNISYVDSNTLTVNPGRCRDRDNRTDITLTQKITKYIDVAWVQGGFSGSPVGGLSNSVDSVTVPSLNAASDLIYGLHVFVIKNEVGDVDVAIDTDISGSHIALSNGTREYPYRRRVGSLYLSHLYGSESGSILTHPYVTIPEGHGLWLYYTTPIELTQSMYTAVSKQWLKCGVPTGNATTLNYFRGKFNTNNVSSVLRFYSNYLTAPVYISGTTPFDIQMADQALRLLEDFDFSTQHIYCLGYYDARAN